MEVKTVENILYLQAEIITSCCFFSTYNTFVLQQQHNGQWNSFKHQFLTTQHTLNPILSVIVVLVVIEVVAGVVLVVASGQIRHQVTCGLRPVTLQFHSMTLNYQGSPEANGLWMGLDISHLHQQFPCTHTHTHSLFRVLSESFWVTHSLSRSLTQSFTESFTWFSSSLIYSLSYSLTLCRVGDNKRGTIFCS